jgi:hypothetical protein
MDPVCELTVRIYNYYFILYQLIMWLCMALAIVAGYRVGLSVPHREHTCALCQDDKRARLVFG